MGIGGCGEGRISEAIRYLGGQDKGLQKPFSTEAPKDGTRQEVPGSMPYIGIHGQAKGGVSETTLHLGEARQAN